MTCGCDGCNKMAPASRAAHSFTSYQMKHMAMHDARKLGWRKLWGVWYFPGHFVPKNITKRPRERCNGCAKKLTINSDRSLRLHFCPAIREKVRVFV